MLSACVEAKMSRWGVNRLVDIVTEDGTVVVRAVLFFLIGRARFSVSRLARAIGVLFLDVLLFLVVLLCVILAAESDLVATSVTKDGLELVSKLGVALALLESATAENVVAVHVENVLDSSNAAGLPAHGGPGGDVPKLERLVVAHVAFVVVLENVFLLIGDLVEFLDGLAALAQGQKGCYSKSGSLESREFDEVLLGELLKHGSEDFLLLGSALNAVAVLLDEDVGDVDTTIVLQAVGPNLVILGVLGSEGIVKLVSDDLDVHAVKHGVANGGKPAALVERTGVVAGDLGSPVVDQVKVPDAADDSDSSLAVLDHDDLGKTVDGLGVSLLPVEDLLAESIDADLEMTVVELIDMAKFLVKTSGTTGRVRDSEGKRGRGWPKGCGIGRFGTLTPRRSDGLELLGKLRRGRHY